jgi:hypothetical protein
MEWQIIVVLVVFAPLILFPAAFIWYVNIGGFYKELKARRAEKAAKTERVIETGGLSHAPHKA